VDYGKSWHAASRAKNPLSKAAWCSDCHGKHDIKPSSDPTSRTNHFNVPATCMRCHGDPKIFPRAGGADGSETVSFHDSIHGKALEKSGLKVAPNCATCHGFHEIRSPRRDPKSTVAREHVPGTCGSCHSKILDEYSASIHGEQLAKGNESVPVCSDCHSAHAISGTPEVRRLTILAQCGSCHDSSLRSYRDTYHGQVSELGKVLDPVFLFDVDELRPSARAPFFPLFKPLAISSASRTEMPRSSIRRSSTC